MLRVRTLGGLSALRPGRDSSTAIQPRRLAVLALVARAGGRGVTRERVLGLLWPDSDEEAGRKALSQALWSLRRELGSEELFEGVQELRLNPGVASCDAVEFEAACAAGELDRAAALYEGLFLEGFRLSGAPEFERWVEEERIALAHRHARVLEQLARQATERGDHGAAVIWWRKLAVHDPLNSRVAVELMQALVQAGDRGGALQHARIYEALLEQELELPPEQAVVALAEKIRSELPAPVAAAPPQAAEPAAVAHPAEVLEAGARGDRAAEWQVEPAAAPVARASSSNGDAANDRAPVGAASGEDAPLRRNRSLVARLLRRPAALATALLLVLVMAASSYAVRRSNLGPAGARPAAGEAVPVLAVGHIADHTAGENVAAALADMLATSLARAEGIRVISTPRLYSLVEGEHRSENLALAAQKAGAGLLIEASVYRTATGTLRLDLRRIDLRSGALLAAQTVEAEDLFALVDEGTRSLVASLGARAPAGSVGGVSTRSAAAYKLYEQGLRTYLNGDMLKARPLFDSALAEDSTFAMAAFYAALSESDRYVYEQRIRTALRLAEHASDRERLFIRVNWAYEAAAPALHALADSLVTRYPMEVEGHLYLGRALYLRGNHLAAVSQLERAVSMDSAAIRRARVPCHGCSALRWLIATHAAADSFEVAIRWARRWVESQPEVADAWWRLAEVLEMAGQGDESVLAGNRAMELEPGRPYGWRFATGRGLRTARFDEVDPLLRSHLNTGMHQHRSGALWMLAISLRYQGRLAESLAEARRNREQTWQNRIGDAVHWIATAEAQAMLEAGRWRSAVALWDSIARYPMGDDPPSLQARHKAWYGAHAATALAAGGDVTALASRADSVEAWGRLSASGRDVMLHHYVRGLLLAQQGRDEEAVESFRRSIVSPTTGYTRANLELARVLLRLQRPREAIPLLQAALRGGIEANNLYVTHTELHEALALAWDAAGVADSAAAHYAWVARAWQQTDPVLHSRRDAAARRLRELRGR